MRTSVRTLPAFGARSRPVDLGRVEVSGVELVHEQDIEVFLFDRPLLRGGPGGGQHHGKTIALHLAGAKIGLVQLDPFRRDPALVLEHPKLGIGTLEMHEAHEQQRQRCPPACIAGLGQRALERLLVCHGEALAHLPQRLPDPLSQLRRAFDILDVLLDQLTAIGAKRRIEELDRADAIQVDRALQSAQRVERLDHMLLPSDHVERRQLTQPCAGRLRALQRIADVLALQG